MILRLCWHDRVDIYWNEEGRGGSRFGGWNREFNLRHTVFEMLVRHSGTCTEYTFGDRSFEFWWKVRNANINCEVISLQMIFKAVRLDELIYGVMWVEKRS